MKLDAIVDVHPQVFDDRKLALNRRQGVMRMSKPTGR
jgi:hypothetical protein